MKTTREIIKKKIKLYNIKRRRRRRNPKLGALMPFYPFTKNDFPIAFYNTANAVKIVKAAKKKNLKCDKIIMTNSLC